MTNPSTVNNRIQNFKPALLETPETFKKEILDANKASWNPYGTNSFTFENCSITRAYYSEGGQSNNMQHRDSFLEGKIVNPSKATTMGRLVDLDPQQQLISQIWGFKVNVDNLLQGDFYPTGFSEIFFRRADSGGMGAMSAIYDSVLTNVTSSPASSSSSPLLKKLIEEAKRNENKLSIRFVVDGYTSSSSSPNFTLGRVVGYISPYLRGYPATSAVCRHLIIQPTDLSSGDDTRSLKVKVCDQKLIVDFSNFIPTNQDLTLRDIGDIHIGYEEAGVKKELGVLKSSQYANASTTEFYLNNAGIYEFLLDPKECKKIKNIPLAAWFQSWDPSPIPQTIYEDDEGMHVAVDRFFFRLDAGVSESGTLYASKFGEPVSVSPKDVTLTPAIWNIDGSIDPERLQKLQDAPSLQLKTELTTNLERGHATSFKVTAPKSLKLEIDGKMQYPRSNLGIDGLVYSILPSLKKKNGKQVLAAHPIFGLVFDDIEIPTLPTWLLHIHPILRQMANLYPSMQNLVDLSNYSSVIRYLPDIRRALSVDYNSSAYMPVTRDLSAIKRKMLMQWLNEPVYSTIVSDTLSPITSLEQLKTALQDSIHLEFSTILLYMSALYSIKPGQNLEVAAIFRTIVRQEMRHMLMAANLLNAIGGQPVLKSPILPGRLPGNVLPNLLLTLGPCTKEAIENIFMVIEEPGYISHADLMEIIKNSRGAPVMAMAASNQETKPLPDVLIYHKPLRKEIKKRMSAMRALTKDSEILNTIGEFYDNIRSGFELLDKELGSKKFFSGNPAKQITSETLSDVFAVYDLKTAKMGIEKIVLEGEGTSFVQPTDEHGQMSHYFRFLEIVLGRKITGIKVDVVAEAEVFKFLLGEVINFDETGVVTDPKVWNSQEVEPRLIRFIESYSGLLTLLQNVFTYKKEDLKPAVAVMRQLQIEALQLLHPGLIQNNTYHSIAPSFDLSKLPKSATPPAPEAAPAEVRSQSKTLYQSVANAKAKTF